MVHSWIAALSDGRIQTRNFRMVNGAAPCVRSCIRLSMSASTRRNPERSSTSANCSTCTNTALPFRPRFRPRSIPINWKSIAPLRMCLDLPETRKFVHASGQVMWTDDTGRAGVRFSFLPDSSRQVLKEWLFANLLVASTNHSARTTQLAHHHQELRATGIVTEQLSTTDSTAATSGT